MGRIIGIIFIVAAIYFAANYVTEHKVSVDGDDGPAQSTPQRVGSKVEDAFERGNARRDALIPD